MYEKSFDITSLRRLCWTWTPIMTPPDSRTETPRAALEAADMTRRSTAISHKSKHEKDATPLQIRC